jgi:ABC-type bacteriocin/lantibiotic exporter with double-glycine peptidase domain
MQCSAEHELFIFLTTINSDENWYIECTDRGITLDQHFDWRTGSQAILSWLNRRQKIRLASLVGLAVLGAVAELATIGALFPFLTFLADPGKLYTNLAAQRAFDALGFTGNREIVLVLAIGFGLIVLAAAAIRVLVTFASARFMMEIDYELAVRIYERVLYRPYKYHVETNQSEIIAGVGKVGAVVGGVMIPMLDITVACVTVVGIFVGLLFIDWHIAVLAFGTFGAIYLAISTYSKTKLERNSILVSKSISTRTRVTQEGLGGIRDVILDGSQPLHLGRFRLHHGAANKAQAANNLWGQIPRHLIEALGTIVIAGIAVFTSQRQGGIVSALPTLGALAVGAQKLLPLFQRIYAGWSQITGHRGFLIDVATLAGETLPANITVKRNPSQLKFEQSISLENIGFRYGDKARWIFRGLSLKIRKGDRVGFAGKTGCGKSTLLDIIMGLLEPTEGVVAIDGEVLTEVNLRHWQARIAHVPQNIFLSDSTIAENIAFGETRNQIDARALELAARRARVHEFIESLPEKYETAVGERGIKLSGGQRQRIGIARALYRKADVLILDEATSALDGETESSVMEGIAEIGSDTTVLIVAHRLSTLDGCNFVVRLNSSDDQEKQRHRQSEHSSVTLIPFQTGD